MIAEIYTHLSRLIAYPEKKEVLCAGSDAISRHSREQGIPPALASFAEFVAQSSLAAIQEEYVATFDFSPAVALYLGHHLYGDNQKKALYLINIKQEFRRYGFTPFSNELPDHFPLLLEFLAHLARHEGVDVRQAFISECVLPGMERLVAGFDSRKNSPWQPVMKTCRLFCLTDATFREEVTPCRTL